MENRQIMIIFTKMLNLFILRAVNCHITPPHVVFYTVVPARSCGVLHGGACTIMWCFTWWCLHDHVVFYMVVPARSCGVLHGGACTIMWCFTSWCLHDHVVFYIVVPARSCGVLHRGACTIMFVLYLTNIVISNI